MIPAAGHSCDLRFDAFSDKPSQEFKLKFLHFDVWSSECVQFIKCVSLYLNFFHVAAPTVHQVGAADVWPQHQLEPVAIK